MKIAPTRLPLTINSTIRTACKKVTPMNQPFFVKVFPHKTALKNKCIFNVQEYIDKFGGEKVLGWKVTIWPKVMIELIGHAIIKKADEYYCITPPSNNEQKLLFLEDQSLTFNYNDPMARMPVKYVPLSDDLTISKLIAKQIEIDKILRKYPPSSDAIKIFGQDAVLLSTLRRDLKEQLRRVLLKTHHHNNPCICGSTKKFRKCCKPEMESVGPI